MGFGAVSPFVGQPDDLDGNMCLPVWRAASSRTYTCTLHAVFLSIQHERRGLLLVS